MKKATPKKRKTAGRKKTAGLSGVVNWNAAVAGETRQEDVLIPRDSSRRNQGPSDHNSSDHSSSDTDWRVRSERMKPLSGWKVSYDLMKLAIRLVVSRRVSAR